MIGHSCPKELGTTKNIPDAFHNLLFPACCRVSRTPYRFRKQWRSLRRPLCEPQ